MHGQISPDGNWIWDEQADKWQPYGAAQQAQLTELPQPQQAVLSTVDEPASIQHGVPQEEWLPGAAAGTFSHSSFEATPQQAEYPAGAQGQDAAGVEPKEYWGLTDGEHDLLVKGEEQISVTDRRVASILEKIASVTGDLTAADVVAQVQAYQLTGQYQQSASAELGAQLLAFYLDHPALAPTVEALGGAAELIVLHGELAAGSSDALTRMGMLANDAARTLSQSLVGVQQDWINPTIYSYQQHYWSMQEAASAAAAAAAEAAAASAPAAPAGADPYNNDGAAPVDPYVNYPASGASPDAATASAATNAATAAAAARAATDAVTGAGAPSAPVRPERPLPPPPEEFGSPPPPPEEFGSLPSPPEEFGAPPPPPEELGSPPPPPLPRPPADAATAAAATGSVTDAATAAGAAAAAPRLPRPADADVETANAQNMHAWVGGASGGETRRIPYVDCQGLVLLGGNHAPSTMNWVSQQPQYGSGEIVFKRNRMSANEFVIEPGQGSSLQQVQTVLKRMCGNTDAYPYRDGARVSITVGG